MGPRLESVVILILVMKIALQGWAERPLAGIETAVEPFKGSGFYPLLMQGKSASIVPRCRYVRQCTGGLKALWRDRGGRRAPRIVHAGVGK